MWLFPERVMQPCYVFAPRVMQKEMLSARYRLSNLSETCCMVKGNKVFLLLALLAL